MNTATRCAYTARSFSPARASHTRQLPGGALCDPGLFFPLGVLPASSAARQEAEAIHDRQRLVERIAVIEARLAQIDPDFHGEAVAALRVLRGAGGRPGGALGSPVAED